MFDGKLQRAKSAFLRFRDGEPATGQAQRVDALLDGGQLDAGVDKGAEGHVAADAASTVEVGDSHGGGVFKELSAISYQLSAISQKGIGSRNSSVYGNWGAA
jgi:hypothetical protein